MPLTMANNRTHFIKGLTSFPNDPNNFDATNSILNENNPTILPLYRNGPNGTKHTDLDETLLSLLTGSYHPDFIYRFFDIRTTILGAFLMDFEKLRIRDTNG